jgi:hypothetical protein
MNTTQKKESLWDWYNTHQQELAKTAAIIFSNYNAGTLSIQYPSGFTWELSETDFPNRNLIPVYAKNSKGKYYIDHYEQGQDAIPSPSAEKSFVGGNPHKPFINERVQSVGGLTA